MMLSLTRERCEGVRSAAVPAMVCSGPEHVIAVVSDRMAAMIGRDVTGVAARDAFPSMPGGPEVLGLLDRCYQQRQPITIRDLPLGLAGDASRGDRGTAFLVPLRDAAGDVAGVLALGLDLPRPSGASAAPSAAGPELPTIFDAMPDPVAVLDLAGGIVHANRAFRRYVDAPLAHLGEIVSAEDREPALEALADAIAGGAGARVRVRVRGRQGQRRWHDIQIAACGRDCGGEWLAVLHDVQDLVEAQEGRLRAEAGLAAMSAECEQLADVLPFAIGILDATSGQLVYANRTGKIDLGLAPDEQPPYDFAHCRRFSLRRDDGSKLPVEEWPQVRALRGEDVAAGEHTVLFRNGDQRRVRYYCKPLLSVWGRVERVIGIAMDVTELHESRAEVERTARELQAVLRAQPDIVFSYDEQGRFHGIFVEDESLLPVPAAELLGRRIEDVLPAELARPMLDAIARCLRGEGPVTVQSRAPMAGAERHYETRFVRCSDTDVIALARDVTELVQLRARTAAADRLSATGALSGSIAHEIASPLMVAMAQVGQLSRRLRARADQSERAAAVDMVLVESVGEALERVASVLSDVRTFARLSPDRTQQVDLRGVIEASLRIAMPGLRSRADVHTALVPASVRGSEAELGQAFLAVLVNAGEAIDGLGPSSVSVSSTIEGNDVVVRVIDTGRGAPPEIASSMFEPFVSTKASADADGGDSRGLGLYLARWVLERHGGSIAHVAPPAGGAEMVIRLPLAEREETAASPSPRARRQRPRVLIADDDVGVRKVLARTLVDFEVLQAEDGIEAIEIIDREPGLAAVVCDWTMPRAGGAEVIDHLRARRPALLGSFVLLTGLAPPERATGGVVVIEKPFATDEIAGLLERLVSQADMPLGG